MYKFNSQVHMGDYLPTFTDNEVKNEPMLFSCDRDASIALGGPITKAFLDSLYPEFLNHPDFILDTRVHMLMPGWFPYIPGYHHDDVPRNNTNGQPNYDNPEYRSLHAMALINGDVCPTEFALGHCDMAKVPDDGIIYKEWHKDVEKLLEDNLLEKWYAPTNQVVYFDCETFHQGTRARKNGWRWFGRASIQTNRKPVNEIRRQVQVYLENPMEGW